LPRELVESIWILTKTEFKKEIEKNLEQ